MRLGNTILLCFGLLVAAETAAATTITLTVGKGGAAGDYILGEVIPPEKGQEGGQIARDMLMVNTLLDKELGTYTGAGTVDDPYYYRSTTNFGQLPVAVAGGAVGKSAFTALNGQVSITLPGSLPFRYLVATWDGKNAGSQVWYIGGIAAGTTLLFPLNVDDAGAPAHLTPSTKHALTHYSLFNPYEPDIPEVPESGTTLVLLGSGLLALGILRKVLAGS